MTELILIRHGQASFGGADYDRLSALGQRQCQLLGEHWRRLGLQPDAAFCGALARQRDSGEIALRAAGSALPLQQSAAFDEYDFRALFRAYGPQVTRAHPELAVTETPAADPRRFQRYFTHVIDCWVCDLEPEAPLPERWREFCARVEAGLRDCCAERRQRVAVFTSGGVIAVAMRIALALSDERTFAVNWRIRNASVHRFTFGRNGLSLLAFNDVAHLELARDADLISYR